MKKEFLTIPIHQPYAWFLMNGHKDIENRTRRIADKWLGQRVAVLLERISKENEIKAHERAAHALENHDIIEGLKKCSSPQTAKF